MPNECAYEEKNEMTRQKDKAEPESYLTRLRMEPCKREGKRRE